MLPVLLAALLLAPLAAADGGPPEAPRDVVGETTSTGHVLLSWLPPSQGSVDGYRVYENGQLVAEVADLSIELVPPPAAVYTVSAYNVYGEGPWGDGVVYGLSLDPSCATARPSVDPDYCIEMAVDLVWWIVGLIPVPGGSP